MILFDQVGRLKGFGAEKIIPTLSINQGLWADGCLALSYDNVRLGDGGGENTTALSQHSSSQGGGKSLESKGTRDGARSSGLRATSVGTFFRAASPSVEVAEGPGTS